MLGVVPESDRRDRVRASRDGGAQTHSPTATPSSAAAELGEALGLWRGDALADCRGGGWAAAEALRLDELRLSTVEDRIDADLMLGQHGVLVGELESLVARHPLRERLWGALMLALYRAGRQAEAVRAYQRARDVLVEELGLEPGAELRRLEAAVLAGDSVLDLPDATRRAPRAELAIPLPGRLGAASSAVFVGRAHEREGLSRSLQAVAEGERRVVLVSGEPGIGKTSLSTAFAGRRSDNGAVVLYGRCDEDLGIPYQPWAEVLTHLVAHAPDDLLAAHVDARGSELARLAPDLAARTTAGRISSSDAESERYLLFGAVVDLLARVSALAPIVLVLDDLHWADRPTIQLLRHVVVGGCAASAARDRHVPRLRRRPGSPARRGARRAASRVGESSGSRCAVSATTSSSPCSRRRPATRCPTRVWPSAMRCRPRRTAIRSSSVRCSGTWPRRGPSTEDEQGAGSRARTCGRRACRSASAR